jgi:hypothetical protein
MASPRVAHSSGGAGAGGARLAPPGPRVAAVAYRWATARACAAVVSWLAVASALAVSAGVFTALALFTSSDSDGFPMALVVAAIGSFLGVAVWYLSCGEAREIAIANAPEQPAAGQVGGAESGPERDR